MMLIDLINAAQSECLLQAVYDDMFCLRFSQLALSTGEQMAFLYIVFIIVAPLIISFIAAFFWLIYFRRKGRKTLINDEKIKANLKANSNTARDTLKPQRSERKKISETSTSSLSSGDFPQDILTDIPHDIPSSAPLSFVYAKTVPSKYQTPPLLKSDSVVDFFDFSKEPQMRVLTNAEYIKYIKNHVSMNKKELDC